MPWRVSFFSQVQQARLGGWSENFWSTIGDLSDVVVKATALRNRLLDVRGKPVQMPTIRISDVDHFREVKLLGFSDIPFLATDPEVQVDYVTTAALLRLTAPPNYTTNQWIRGIYDVDTNTAGRLFPTPAHVVFWNALYAELTNGANSWALRRQDRSAPIRRITAISQTGEVSCLGHGLDTDNRTRISRVISPKIANQIWRVVRLTADTFALVGYPTQGVPATIGLNTVSVKRIPIFVQIAGATSVRATSHKTGRPFGQLSGRRRTRAR